MSALAILKTQRLTDESYQNMLIAQNGLEVLVNILECEYDDCMVGTLSLSYKAVAYTS